MLNRRPAALTRRSFLLYSGFAVGTLALPNVLRATESDLAAVAFDGETLLVAGRTMARSEDGGTSWRPLPAPEGILALSTHPQKPGRVLAGLAAGGVGLSDDGGRTWTSRSAALPDGAVQALSIAAGEPDTVYAAVRGDGLWKSDDAGENWSLAMDRPWLDGSERDLLTLSSVDLATGMGGIWIYAGTRTGLTRVPDCFCRWQDVVAADAMDGLVSGDTPSAISPLPAGATVHAIASAVTAPEILYAGLQSGVFKSTDGGVNWAPLADGFTSAIAVHPGNQSRVLAVIEGVLNLSRDGGESWTALSVP